MLRKRLVLLRQILLFLLFTLLGVVTGYLTNQRRPSALLAILERSALPLAGAVAVVIVVVMVWQHLAEERDNLVPAWDSVRPPFPGLDAFTEQDAGVFFGRTAETAELLDRLHPASGARAHRLVTVVGPSGVGKSSLVFAGLLPRLEQRRLRWIVVPPLVPEDHPLRSMARSLFPARDDWPAGSSPTADPRSFADCVESLRAAAGGRSGPVLITIDQGEELLTLTGQQEREEFLGLIENALQADQRLWILVIMRSEFLTDFLATPHARLFREPVTVGALSRASLFDVIAGHARRSGWAEIRSAGARAGDGRRCRRR